jgi:hypothetical protein
VAPGLTPPGFVISPHFGGSGKWVVPWDPGLTPPGFMMSPHFGAQNMSVAISKNGMKALALQDRLFTTTPYHRRRSGAGNGQATSTAGQLRMAIRVRFERVSGLGGSNERSDMTLSVMVSIAEVGDLARVPDC